jgi:hypothetical protein
VGGDPINTPFPLGCPVGWKEVQEGVIHGCSDFLPGGVM